MKRMLAVVTLIVLPRGRRRGSDCGTHPEIRMVRILLAIMIASVAAFTFAFAQQQGAQSGSPATPATPDQFKPILGGWQAQDPKWPMRWRINSVSETGAVEIDYFFMDVRVQNMKGEVTIRDGRLHLSLIGGDRTWIKWDLDYYPNFGGMLDGTAAAQGGSRSMKVYRQD